MSTKSLIASVINSKHGWAVAEQFEATWSQNEPFDEQNPNALKEIEKTCVDLLESGLLAEKPCDEIKDYLFELRSQD